MSALDGLATPRDLVLGIDSSTTACKAIVWDVSGRLVAEGRSPLTMFTPRLGLHEQDAADWWRALCSALRSACSQIDVRRLAGLAVAHQRETFVGVNADGDPLHPAILWMDERAAPLLDELGAAWGQDAFHAITGKPLSVNLSLPKIAWLQRERPDVFERAVHYLDVHAFLVQRLTGVYATGWGCAGPMGMFDMRTDTWAEGLLHQVGLTISQMPSAHPPGALLGHVTDQAAESTGLPAGLPVFAGLGDGQAAGLGVGAVKPGDAYLALGTSVVSGTYSRDFVIHPALRTMYGGCDYLLETALLGGGYTVNWLRRFLGGTVSLEDLDEQALHIPAGSEGLLLVPYWNSVLGPYWDADASGIVVGWRGVHSPAHLWRAILEGIAFEQRLNMEAVEAALGNPLNRYIAVGGGARSDLWCQIMADVTGRPIYRAATLEAASLGAGVLAATGAGLFADGRAASLAMTRLQASHFKPDPRSQAYYDQLYAVYRDLFPNLQATLKRLKRLVGAAG